jgi:mannose-6-phosphate isomerase-like protein (cupin superfamily)
LSEEIRYYRGLYKVRVVTESEGYWIVEALEEFEDTLDGENVTVKVGEKRIVPPRTVHKHKNLPPPIKEHAYELQMEKKVKHLVAKEKKKRPKKKASKPKVNSNSD